jgi:hypothetical protein
MSLGGFARVSVDDWKKLRTGSEAIDVPAGDYIGQVVKVRYLDPEKNKKGLGSVIIGLKLTDDNEDEYKGGLVEAWDMYHPGYDSGDCIPGHATMTRISLQNWVQLCEAANVEPVEVDGQRDIFATLDMLPTMKPTVAFSVTKRKDDDGNPRQDVAKFRPTTD